MTDDQPNNQTQISNVPEYPNYSTRKVGEMCHAYSRLGDNLFRGDGPLPKHALADLDSQVIRYRLGLEDKP